MNLYYSFFFFELYLQNLDDLVGMRHFWSVFGVLIITITTTDKVNLLCALSNNAIGRNYMTSNSKSLSKYKPFVSVVIPTYNRKNSLKNCIVSLFNQTYPKDMYEVIVVNDGSTDGTEEILKEYEKKAPCKFKWFTQRNQGSYAARNLGIEMAKGGIICFIDDDCIADKHWIEKLVEGFTDGWVGGVGGQIIAYNPKKIVEEYAKFDQEEAIKGEFYPSFLITCNAAYRKDILENCGYFDPYFRSGGDVDMGIRVTWKGYKLKYAPDAIVYHKHRTTFMGFIKQRYAYGTGCSCLGKKYFHFPLLEIFIFLIFKLGLNIILIPKILGSKDKKKELSERFLNILSIFFYLIGIINGYLLQDYPKDKVVKDKIESLTLFKNKIRLGKRNDDKSIR